MQLLRDWARVTGGAAGHYWPPPDLTRLRIRLIKEEHEEVREELVKFIANPVDGDRPALAKELADLVYVIYGTAVALDIDLDEALARVHESNLSKRFPDGTFHARKDGKILKGPNYVAPNLSDFGPIKVGEPVMELEV